MRESEAGQERLQRTKDRIDFRTAQAVEEIVANETGADVVAADNEDIKIEAQHKTATGAGESSPVQLDEQMEVVQLEVGPELQLQDGERRGTDKRFKTPEREVQLQDGSRRDTDRRFSTPERDPATKRRSHDDMDDGPKVRRVEEHFMGTPDGVMA